MCGDVWKVQIGRSIKRLQWNISLCKSELQKSLTIYVSLHTIIITQGGAAKDQAISNFIYDIVAINK